MAKARKQTFSVTKAVKANARERVGTPKATITLPTIKDKALAKPKHKETLQQLLSKTEED